MVKYLLWWSIVFLVFAEHSALGAEMERFDWWATESAPRGYPIEIISGELVAPEGESIYIPSGKMIHHGWGEGVSTHIVGPELKLVPAKVGITYFSYTEDQFYHGEFELPYKEMQRLFEKGFYSPKIGEHITFNQVIVGAAPGGKVAVWLGGIDKTTEVFFGQAKKVDLDFKVIIDNPEYPREKYVRLNIEESLSDDELARFKAQGVPFGLWERYHQLRYRWHPLFTNMELVGGKISQIKYYNGENGYLNYPLEEDEQWADRAVPKEMRFIWQLSENKRLSYHLIFDEDETFALFEKLGQGNKPLVLELKLVDTEAGKQFGVLLRNDDEAVYFRKITLKKYAAK